MVHPVSPISKFIFFELFRQSEKTVFLSGNERLNFQKRPRTKTQLITEPWVWPLGP